MANGSPGRIPRSRRFVLRERAEKTSLARTLNISRSSSWEDIFFSEQAQEIEASNEELRDVLYDLGLDEDEYGYPDEQTYLGCETPQWTW